MTETTAWLDRRQVPVYVGAIIVGTLCGLLTPDLGTALTGLINPALAALLYVTFLQVPIAELGRALRDLRFASAVLVVNFLVVPLVVAGLIRFAPDDRGIRIGILLVLLCPCVDYVVVFTRLAGGASVRLLATTPALLLVQLLMLPLYLTLFFDDDLADALDVRPFVEAFLVVIVIPLALAWITQWASRRTTLAQRVERVGEVAMVPLMVAVLVIITASQVPQLDGRFGDVVAVAPIYVVFLAVMVILGAWLSRAWRLDVGARRAVAVSGATRNTLVIMPLALALPAGLEVAAAVVVLQTLVEVIGMAICVRAVPRLIPDRA